MGAKNKTLKKRGKNTRRRKNNQHKYKRSKKINNKLRIRSNVSQKGGDKTMTVEAARAALRLLNDNIGKINVEDYNIFYDVKYVIDKTYLNERCGMFSWIDKREKYCNIMHDVFDDTKKNMDNIEKEKSGNESTGKTIFGSNAHRAKVRGSIILNIDVLSAFFVLSMQILLIENKNDDDTKSLQFLASILIKFFFIDINEDERKQLLERLSVSFDKYDSLIRRIKDINQTTKDNRVIKITDGVILRKLYDIAGKDNTLRMEEVQILLRRGLRHIRGKATGLQRIECLGKLGVWVGIENINVIISVITSMAAGSTVCPYMLIPLIFVLLKFMSCIVDFKMPKIISVVVFGITGMPSFDMSSLQELVKKAGNVFKDTVSKADKEISNAYEKAVEKTNEIAKIDQTIVDTTNKELEVFEEDNGENGDGQIELEKEEEKEVEIADGISSIIIPQLNEKQEKAVQSIESRTYNLNKAFSLIQQAQAEMRSVPENPNK